MADSEPQQVDDSAWKRHEALYSSVGQAISMWASMEGHIIEIAAILIGTSERKAGLIFYSIMNFFAWLSIVDELFSLEEKYEAHKIDWGPYAGTLRALNDTRVRLAHHTVWDHPPDAPTGLRPGKHDVRAKSRKHAALTEDEVLQFTKGVLDISDRLRSLIKRMNETGRAPKPSQGKLFEQSDDQQNQVDIPLNLLSSLLKAPPRPSGE